MSLESNFLRSVPLIDRFASPKQLIGASKYVCINRLLTDFKIDLILDVGANVGQFGRSMRRIGYRGRIVSFEPVFAQFRNLQALAQNDEHWTAVNIALGAVEELKEINIMRETVFSSFQNPTTQRTGRFAEQNTIIRVENVMVRRLDQIIDEYGLRDKLKTCFLKCDTQGFDRHVLEGGGVHLEVIRMLMLELSAISIYENTPPMTDMLNYLSGRDFMPVAFFPVTFNTDWTALEFDYLGVNQRYKKAD